MTGHPRQSSGQAIVVFAITLTVIVLLVGLAVDGGYALVQRRSSQNTADFDALAGARIVAVWIAGNANDGNDANVKAAIIASNNQNGGSSLAFGQSGPAYMSSDGTIVGRVGQGWIPAATVGVRVVANRSWAPYFLRFAGINSWSATAAATARGGWAASGPAGAVFPIGIAEAFFNGRDPCSGQVSADVHDPCYPQHLTPGNLNVPGGFGWLKFGCDGYGLGQDPPASDGGCANSKPFLQTEIGPPGNSFGCCTQVGLPGSQDFIGSLPGNKASADCSYWIDFGRDASGRCLGLRRGRRVERLLPHRRLHRLPDHRLQRWQGHRRCLASAVLHRADDSRAWICRRRARRPADSVTARVIGLEDRRGTKRSRPTRTNVAFPARRGPPILGAAEQHGSQAPNARQCNPIRARMRPVIPHHPAAWAADLLEPAECP